MQNAISLLGSTGSIGRQTLEVAEFLGLEVRALSADKNIKLLEEQTRKFKPAVAAVFDEQCARDFKTRVRDTGVRVVPGAQGLIEAACVTGADTVVTAVTGTAGLRPTLAAIEQKRRIALANKETLVCAGALVMRAAVEHGSEIIPVDSEHSALFQCLAARPVESVKKLILTASGGPFRGWSRERLLSVTLEMALKHPVWNMGKKITVDSATMMNKGLEVIEAMHLFDVQPEKIAVLVHPEGVVHSMAEFCDNSVVAQMAQPDMCLPIQYALTYPEREPSPVPELDFTNISALTFSQPDLDAFPCLGLALETAHKRGTAGAALNGANDAAVDLFLQGKLGFYGIYESVSAALENIYNIEDPALEDIEASGESAKAFVFERV